MQTQLSLNGGDQNSQVASFVIVVFVGSFGQVLQIVMDKLLDNIEVFWDQRLGTASAKFAAFCTADRTSLPYALHTLSRVPFSV